MSGCLICDLGMVLRRRPAYTSVNANSPFKMVRPGSRGGWLGFRRRLGWRGSCVNRPDLDSGTAACNHQLVSNPATRLAEYRHLPSDPARRAGLLGKPDTQDLRDDGHVWRCDIGNGMAEPAFEHLTTGAFDRSRDGPENRQHFQDRG